MAHFEGHPFLQLGYTKENYPCLLRLHNFIRDSNLRDKQFDRCDSDENYIPKVQRQAITLPGDHVPGALHTRNMNTTRDDIADSLFNARQH